MCKIHENQKNERGYTNKKGNWTFHFTTHMEWDIKISNNSKSTALLFYFFLAKPTTCGSSHTTDRTGATALTRARSLTWCHQGIRVNQLILKIWFILIISTNIYWGRVISVECFLKNLSILVGSAELQIHAEQVLLLRRNLHSVIKV